MAQNRKNESTAIRFGPALKVFLGCAVIVGCCLGYLWQQQQITDLGQQKGKREARLRSLRDQNEKLRRLLAQMESPAELDKRVKELNLGLAPTQHGQVWILREPPVERPAPYGNAQYAAGPAHEPPVP